MNWPAFRTAWFLTTWCLFAVLMAGTWYGAHRDGTAFPLHAPDVFMLGASSSVLALVAGLIAGIVKRKRS